jgi:hypothetical protein
MLFTFTFDSSDDAKWTLILSSRLYTNKNGLRGTSISKSFRTVLQKREVLWFAYVRPRLRIEKLPKVYFTI